MEVGAHRLDKQGWKTVGLEGWERRWFRYRLEQGKQVCLTFVVAGRLVRTVHMETGRSRTYLLRH